MRISRSILGVAVAAAGAAAAGLLLAAPAAACEIQTSLCNPGGGSSSTNFHITQMGPVDHYTGPTVSLPTNTPGGGSGNGGGGNGGGGGDGSNTGMHLAPMKIKIQPSGGGGNGGGPDGVLKDQLPKLPKSHDLLVKGGGNDKDELNLLIACRTLDGETDLRFRNVGSAVILAGSQVRWSVKPTGQHGAIRLPRDIKVGASVNAHDLLRNAAADGFTCSSHLL